MKEPTLPLTTAQLLDLAPLAIENRHGERYRGDTVTVSLTQIPEADTARLRLLYMFLLRVKQVSGAHVADGARGIVPLQQTLQIDFETVSEAVAQIGAQLAAEHVDADVRKALHDIRGGSLMALMMHLDIVREGEAEGGDLERIFILTRDHLKMMRNAIYDLDPERYAADLETKEHAIELLREKWSSVAYRIAGGYVQVHFHCEFDGAISERCMEFSALDRVLYNFVNNAARFATDGRVDIVVTPLSAATDTHLRFAVINGVSANQVQTLRTRFPTGLSELYRGGFTTGGHGIGLRIVGDFVTHAYGRESLDRSLDDELLGATLIDSHFVAWFHWPGRRSG